MKSIHSFQQRLAKTFRHWEDREYQAALKVVDALLTECPANGQLHILWASLVLLQEETEHTLDEARSALQRAVALEKDSPAGSIELGHFLDAVEDNPQAALKSFGEGIAAARRWLIAGLVGQAKALLQLDKREAALKCLMEAVYLLNMDSATAKDKATSAGVDLLMAETSGGFFALQRKESLPRQITDLFQELMSNRPV
jgi:tetratricopeptide (TPR) repeat protein